MTTRAFQRMRLQSHAYIKRQIERYEQRMQLLSKQIDRQATCKYNARSAFLRCAVNPSGSCSQCRHYEAEA